MRHSARAASLFVFAALLFSLPSFAARREGNLTNAAVNDLRRDVVVGQQMRIEKVPLLGRFETLELERFEVFAPDARIVVRRGDREEVRPRPTTRYYRGAVAGLAGSLAVMSVGNEITGLVIANDKVYSIAKGGENARRATAESDLVVTEIDPEADAPDGAAGWVCDVMDGVGPHHIAANQLFDAPITPQATTGGSPTYTLRLAIEADYEMYQVKGNSIPATETYIGNLIAAASAIYLRDVKTTLEVGTLFTYATNTDPWTSADSSTALDELLAYYNASRRGVSRSAALLVSGKNMGGGIAYVSAACQGDWANGNAWHYGVVGSMTGTVNTSNPGSSTYWDVLAFTHELGHLAGSSHTHCTSSTGYGRAFVDLCYSGEGGCYSGPTSLPVEKGTIMSYCHLLGGGYSNVRMMFGQGGEASEKINQVVTTYVDSRTPNGTLTAPSSLNAGSTGNLASVPNVAGLTYTWSVSGGTITAGTGTSQITFTAGAGATMSVTVTVRNSSGCAVTNSKTITIVNPITCNATITAPASVPAGSTGNLASVPAQTGATYTWSIANGIITAGQGTRQVTFTGGGSRTPLTLVATVSNIGCSDTQMLGVGLTGKPTFFDVPPTSGYYNSVEKVYDNGITGGCGGALYCPDSPVTRAQMAVFLLLAKNGSGFTPLPATGSVFLDVPANSFAAAWIERLAADGVTGGCGGGNYCPSSPITRAQMAVFLLVTKEGTSYAPPAATGTVFNDVPANGFAAAWIEEIARRGITGGCGGGNFCPNTSVTRGQMAVFLVTTFNLP